MSLHRRRLRGALGAALCALLAVSCAPASPRVTVNFRVDAEQFRPDYLLVTWLAPDGKNRIGMRIPEDGSLMVGGPLLGSMVVDMADAPPGDRTVIAWGMRGLLQVSGAREIVAWQPGSRRDVTLTLGCVKKQDGGPPVDGQISQAPWLACQGSGPDAAVTPAKPDAAAPDAAAASEAPDAAPAPVVEPPDAAGPPDATVIAADAPAPVVASPDAAADAPTELDAPMVVESPDGPPPPPPLPAGADLGKGLVAYLRFEERAGSPVVHDLSGNGGVATLHELDVVNAWVPGLFGTALDVGGKGWVNVDSTTALNTITDAFTLSAWVNRGGDGSIVSRRYVGANGFLYRLFISGGLLGVQINSTSGANANLLSDRAVPFGAWVHVLARFDHLNANLFIGGAGVGQQRYELSIASETSPLLVGADEDATLVSGEARFKGAVDEVAVYNRALSGDEITGLARGSQPPAK